MAHDALLSEFVQAGDAEGVFVLLARYHVQPSVSHLTEALSSVVSHMVRVNGSPVRVDAYIEKYVQIVTMLLRAGHAGPMQAYNGWMFEVGTHTYGGTSFFIGDPTCETHLAHSLQACFRFERGETIERSFLSKYCSSILQNCASASFAACPIVKVLVEHGADPNLWTSSLNDVTNPVFRMDIPLHCAILCQNTGLIELLVNFGAIKPQNEEFEFLLRRLEQPRYPLGHFIIVPAASV